MNLLGHSTKLAVGLIVLALCIRNLAEVHGKLTNSLMIVLVK